MIKHKILLGLTTTRGSDWRDKMREIDEFGIKEIAAFPTCLELPERKELYEALKGSKIESIPHLHIRSDMEEWELDFFRDQYGTELFNIHPSDEGLALISNNPEYQSKIYLENTGELSNNFFSGLPNSAGLCLDFTHWYDYQYLQNRSDYQNFDQTIRKYSIGCCHISAIKPNSCYVIEGDKKNLEFNSHTFANLSEFDYINKVKEYLPEVISIELSNTLKEQMEVKKYLEELI